jgi:hypothetical protein
MRVGFRAGLRFVFVLAVCSAAPRVVMAQAPEISVRRTGPEQLTADPGARITVSFMVTNRGRRDRLVETRLSLPRSWQPVIPDSGVAVSAGGSELNLIPIAIPPDARAGPYVVRYAAAQPAPPSGSSGVQDSVVITVAERKQMAAELSSAPRFVAAGESYRADFVIRNAGNAPAIARVQLTGNQDIAARLDSAFVHLEPGEERKVSALVGTNAGEGRKIIQRVGVLAMSSGDSTTRASAVSIVEVVPRRTRAASARHSVPMQLGLGSTGEDGRLTPELRGGGFLSPARAARVDFLFRPRSPGSFMAAQDEYWMTIGRADHYRVRLGDQSYGTSRLLQPFRPGAGGAAEVVFGRLTLGAQGQRDRRSYFLSRESQYGGTIDLRLLADRASVGGAFLSRSGVNPGTILQGHGGLQLPGSSTFQWEYGLGNSRRGRGDAYVALLSGSVGRLSYGLQREASDSAFPGLGAGITHSAATLRLPATRHVTLFGSVAQNLAVVSSASSVLHREVESGVDLTHFLGLAYRLTRDTGFTPAPAKTGTSIRAFATLPLRRLTLGARVEGGYSVNDGAPTVHIPFRRIGGNTVLSIAGQSLGASIERLNGTPTYGFTAVDQTSGQITAGIRLTNDTRLNVSFSTTRSPAALGGAFSLLDIGLDQRLPMGHQAQWRGQSLSYGPGTLNQRSRQHAQYLIPISVPVPGTDESGAVDVQLLEGSAGRPVAGAVVRFGGDARITDGAGRAKFSGFAPGAYYLDLDRAYLGPGRIVKPALPLTVEVVRGEKRAVELRINGAAYVEGAVHLMEFDENRRLGAPDTLVDAGGQSYVHLQLTSSGDTLRTVSNGGGHFRFGDLHPGHWVLTVLSAGVPPLHHVEVERVEFDLRPGDAREVSIRLLPVRQTVRFIEEAELKTTPEQPKRVARPGVPAALRKYIVRRRDVSLMQVALNVYEDVGLWPKLWVANRGKIARPEALHVGQRIVVPAFASLTAAEIAARNEYLASVRRREGSRWPVADSTWQPPLVRHWYTVTIHDVGLLYIASAMYGNASLWPKIWVANLDQLVAPEQLRAGQRLRVPEPAPLTPEEIAARDAYFARKR